MTSLRLDGGSEDESLPVGGADANAEYWVGDENPGLPNAHNLGALATGLVINTAGVPSIATLVGLTLVGNTLTATGGEILTGTAGQIVKTGTVLSLADTAVTPGSYDYASITVDAKGRLTAASSNSVAITAITDDVDALKAPPYLVGATSGGILSGERVVGDGAMISVNLAVSGQASWELIDNSITVDKFADFPAFSVLGRDAITTGQPAPIEHPGTGGAMVLIADPLALYPGQAVGVKFRALIDMDLPFAGSTMGENGILRWYEYKDLVAMESTVPFYTIGSPDSHVLASYGLQFLAPLTLDSMSSFNTHKIGVDIAGVIPLTTKGDILGYSTIATRVAVGSNGKVLTADSTAAAGVSWQTPSASGYATIERPNGTPVTARSILSLTTEFTATDNVDTTDIALATNGVAFSKIAQGSARSVLGVTGNATADVASVQGTADQVLRVNTAGTALAFGTIATAGIADAAVTVAKLADLAGLSVIGRSTNSSGVTAAITAVTDGHVLRLSGTTLGFGTLAAGAFGAGTIAGSVFSGFTTGTFPVGSSGALVDSVLTQASNVLTYTVSAGGTNVGITASNTSTAASSTARLTARVGGTATGNAGITLGITSGSDWTIDNVNATNDRLEISRAGTLALSIDPTQTFNQAQIKPNATFGFSFSAWTLAQDARTGNSMFGLNLGANQYTNIGPDTAGTAGHGLAGIFFDGTGWRNAFSFAHASAVGAGVWRMMENGGNAAIGGMAAPTSIQLALLLSNGTAPSATPTGGAVHWAASGVHHFMGTDGVDTIL